MELKVVNATINNAFIIFYVQYDLSASQFSPDGRVFQVEYAFKAVENSGYVSSHYSIVTYFFLIK